MKKILILSVLIIPTFSKAAIFAEPVFEIKESSISDVSIKKIIYKDGSSLIKIIGKNDYKNLCELGDRKLKKVTLHEGVREYEIFNYKISSKDCNGSSDYQTKTYLIDSFKQNKDEVLPLILVNGKYINGGSNERE